MNVTFLGIQHYFMRLLIVKVRLLQHHAEIENIDAFKDDAIYYATIVGDLEIINHLIKKPIDYTKKYGGYTVLELAKHSGNIEIYEKLKKGSLQ